MPEHDLLDILLSHDHWASCRLIDACRGLASDQFHHRFDIGPGSLHDTLTHIVGAMRTWTDTLAATGLRPRLEDDGQRRTPAMLRDLLDEAHAELRREAQRRPLSERVTRRLRTGQTVELSRGEVLAHVATHGMHHRAQCLNMLRRLNVHPLPASSVTEWTWRDKPGQ
jgi:uncharacterized damage-inducible protein DinB